jgi:renalase
MNKYSVSSIAIIGAGSSALAAAHTLLDAGYTVTLFEKSRGVGGRAATRKRAGFIYDHGAQYIKSGNSASSTLVTERFRVPDLIDITKPVWTFDGAGHIQEGDPAQNAEPKWSYRSGLTALSKYMAADLDVHLETRIHHVTQTSSGWLLTDTSAHTMGPFTHLLITLPSPQAIELVQESTFIDVHMPATICAQLDAARYNPLLSVVLGYRPRPQTRQYYALVNTDKAHAISWLAWEHEKAPERAPHDTGLLIAQMAPRYSEQQWHGDDAAIYDDVARRVATLLAEALPTPFFSDIQRWLYALPSAQADAETLNTLTLPAGLAFCGDAFTGGRVHLALEHGIAVAQKMIHL